MRQQYDYHQHDKADLCDLSELNQDTILNTLTSRYARDIIFTRIGPTLIAVNPYKDIEPLFCEQKLKEIRDQVLRGESCKEPHIYMIAGGAFQGMLSKQTKQAIIISGQSGAGKTQSAKYCLRMLTQLSQAQTEETHPIERKLLACNPILEAFGNSKTVRNDNSSRFGKYLQIYFDANQVIKGANIKSYLLEKTRVTSVARQQRNFHIFYGLCSYLHKNPSQYQLLNQSTCYTAKGISDSSFFKQICSAMTDLGFPAAYQQRIWVLLQAVLDLGNLNFDDSNNDRDAAQPCTITDAAACARIARAVGIEVSALQKVLLTSELIMPRQTIIKSLNKGDCISNLSTVCRTIYNSIFQSIVDRINVALHPSNFFEDISRSMINSSFIRPIQEQLPSTTFEINILDIFGFQNFKQNSLEQLCINYANQKLLQVYNVCVFDNEIQNLREDGADVESINPPNNEPKLLLLQAIFKIVKEKTLIKQFRDEDIISAFKTNRDNSQYVRTIEYNKFNDKLFIVKHSPCDVVYSVNCFKAKNLDKISPQIQAIRKSLFTEQANAQTSRTLLQKFTGDMTALIDELKSAQNHYVRCIKPNDQKANSADKLFGCFLDDKNKEKYLPFRKTYDEFADIYKPLFKQTRGKGSREATTFILSEINAITSSYLLGNKRVYVSSEIHQLLNLKMREYEALRVRSANRIIRYFKRKKLFQLFRQAGFKVVERIKKLKKLGEKIEYYKKRNIYCGFDYIKLEAKQAYQLQQQVNFFQSELRNQHQLSQGDQIYGILPITSNQQKKLSKKESQYDTLRTVCRFKDQRNQSQIIRQLNIHKKQIQSQNQSLKNQLQTTNKQLQVKQQQIQKFKTIIKEKDQIICKEAALKQGIISKANERQVDLTQLQNKNLQKQKRLKHLQQLTQNLRIQLNKYKEQCKGQKQQNARLVNKIHQIQQQNKVLKQKNTIFDEKMRKKSQQIQQLNRKLVQHLRTSQVESQLQRELQDKLDRITILENQNYNKHLAISEKTLNLKDMIEQIQQIKIAHQGQIIKNQNKRSIQEDRHAQNIRNKDQDIIRIQKRLQDKVKQNELLLKHKEEDIIRLQKGLQDIGKQKEELLKQNEYFKEQFSKKNKECEDLIKKQNQKTKQSQSKDHQNRLKQIAQQTVQRQRLRIGLLQNQSQQFKKTIKSKEFQIDQLRQLTNNLRNKINQPQKTKSQTYAPNQEQHIQPLSLSQVFQQLRLLKSKMTPEQKQNFRLKIGSLMN